MVRDLLARGVEQHQAGRLNEAKLIYEQALAMDPRDPDALHLLGIVLLQRGSPDRAVGLIEQAIQVHPANPVYHANLAQARLATERVAEALDGRSCRVAVASGIWSLLPWAGRRLERRACAPDPGAGCGIRQAVTVL